MLTGQVLSALERRGAAGLGVLCTAQSVAFLESRPLCPGHGCTGPWPPRGPPCAVWKLLQDLSVRPWQQEATAHPKLKNTLYCKTEQLQKTVQTKCGLMNHCNADPAWVQKPLMARPTTAAPS